MEGTFAYSLDEALDPSVTAPALPYYSPSLDISAALRMIENVHRMYSKVSGN